MVLGASIPRPRSFNGKQRLKGQDNKAEDKQNGVEKQHGTGVLLPVLRTAIQLVLRSIEKVPTDGISRP